MKTTFVVISILLLVQVGYSGTVGQACTSTGYAADAASNQCCPSANSQAAAEVPKGAGVKTCAAAASDGQDKFAAPTHCLKNFQLASDACTACADHTFAAEADTQATTCGNCAAGKDRVAGTADCADCVPGQGTAGGTVCTTCTGATPYGAGGAACAACPAGFTCADGLATPCGSGMWIASAGTSCATITGAATTGCRSYTTAEATHCAATETTMGYAKIVGAAIPQADVAAQACIANCAECTAASTANANDCTKPAVGYGINDNAPATKQLAACAEGCASCDYSVGTVPNKTQKCLSAKPGWAITTANVLTKCEDGKGSLGGLATAGVTCAPCEGMCGHCTTPAICTTCKPGNTATAVSPATTPATVACAAFDQAKIHASCGKAGSDKATECQECKAGEFRDLGMTGTVKNTMGSCVCMTGYYDKSTTTPAPAVWVGICAKCPDNTLSCTAENGVLKDVVCTDATFQKLNLMCVKKDKATVVDKAFWDATKSEFASCFKDCKSCTAATETTCTACLAAAATWKEPATSADAGWETYLKGQWVLVGGKCVDKCPEGYTRKADKTGCEGGPAASGSGSAAASASGVYVIFALVASLLIIF